MSQSHWETQVSNATGYLSNSTKDPSAGDVSKSSGTGSQSDNSIASFFGRAFYSYDDRYLLTATLRRDGSSKFARGNRWGWFPSAALGWKLSNESFLKDNDVINNLKLRFGWGATGNQNVENWAYMAMLSSKTTPWGVGVLTGNTPSRTEMGNYLLHQHRFGPQSLPEPHRVHCRRILQEDQRSAASTSVTLLPRFGRCRFGQQSMGKRRITRK